MALGSRLSVVAATCCFALACTPDDVGSSQTGPTVDPETGDGDGDVSETLGDGDGDPGDGDGDGDGDPEECACAPGTDLIYLASKFGEIYTYDPQTDSYAEVGQTTCGSGLVYSMAVDHQNRGWLVDLDTRDLFTIDLDNPQSCTEPPWVPGNQGFQYPGTAFVSNDLLEVCEKLYLLNYSADGPFAEGEGIGQIGVYDPLDGSVEVLSTIDYDGGELDGIGDGRLFAFVGDNPAKLVEYDRETGEALDTIALDGLEKTSASAFAFHSGDFYFFTEGAPAGCLECLDSCTPSYAQCLGDPECAESFECAFYAGMISDDCGGLMPQELMDCLSNTCLETCFPIGGKRSEVTRLDFDDSEGNGQILEVVNAEAPIRVVGAGTSICAPQILTGREVAAPDEARAIFGAAGRDLLPWAVPPETFSSEIGDVHEGRGGDRGTFSSEFRGASDSLIEESRPSRPIDVGRRGRRVVAIIVLVLGLLGGGGFALWYWAEPIGAWISGLGRGSEPEDQGTAELEPDEGPSESEPEPEPEPELEPEPEKEFGIRGMPEGGTAQPEGGTAQPEDGTARPEDGAAQPEGGTAQPKAASATIEAGATQIRGKVAKAAVEKRLATVDDALPGCWEQARGAGASGTVELTLSFRIKWSGRTSGVNVSGGTDALGTCVRKALPSGGWPHPRDGGEAKVTRRWTLGG